MGISVVEAAKRLDVPGASIYRWVKAGRIGVVSEGERRRGLGMRLNEGDVSRMQRERKRRLLERAARIR